MRWTMLVFVAACGGSSLQTLRIVNRTDRPIEELYVYPVGSANHGTSRGVLAPAGATEIKVSGNVEVYAVSQKVILDAHTREHPTASQGLEIRGPLEVVFYDDNAKPPGLDKPNVIGVAFVRTVVPAAPAPAPEEAPASP